MLGPALRSSTLTRDDELAVRSALAEAWLLQDDLDQAAPPLGRPPDTFRDTVSCRAGSSTLWRLHGRLASARGDQSRAIALHGRALKHAETAHDSRAHRPRPLRARPVLPPGRRHRDRPRAHHQGRVRAARRRRSPASRARPLAVEHLARAARTLRRGDDGAAAGRAPRVARPGRRRAGDGLRQPGERHDARAPLRAGARARRAQRVAARGARLRPRPGGRARRRSGRSACGSAIWRAPRRRCTARSRCAARFSFTRRPAPSSTRSRRFT